MNSDPPSDAPSPAAEPEDEQLADRVRRLGGPLLEALGEHLPGAVGHADASGSFAFAAATELGLDRQGAELVKETARLHAVGKVYVPAELLAKPPEERDDAQRALVDAHHEAGARLALGAGIPNDVCGWILQVRERWEGAGPDGLKGEDIPIASRITRAACVCDVALSGAPRSGPDYGRAIETLRTWAGPVLDPAVATALTAFLLRASHRP